ncbi:hypothetical protein A9Q84_07965 [Halobacteriovorax marinus]|uniref:N-acetyltransferase domain-containing protein n=1 Tax=Halobacteriovorax marinus TaxID=97084 RepID=A0A1Y5F669_9BACT|nr:hypothetical protein A9Q84_07965 [Halobacteriovorax marinus]
MEKQFLSELIVGERISLKRHTVDLAQKMFDYVVEDRERLAQFLPWPKFINTVQDEIDFIRKCGSDWDDFIGSYYGIYRNSDDEYMGNISSFSHNWNHHNCEIGYWILGKFEGQGYMSDAVKLMEKTLFEVGFNRIVIRFDTHNAKSGSIPKRLSYTYEGTLRKVMRVNNVFRDLEVYSKLHSES